MKKIKLFVIYCSITLFITAGIMNLNNLRLNLFALQSVKTAKVVSTPKFSSSGLDCHVRWIVAAQAKDLQAQSVLMPCSPLYMDMIRVLAPTDATLAAQARTLYPDLPEPLYWLAESQGGASAEHTENITLYEEIVTKYPGEGLAWCYLGGFYEQAGDLQASLEARINCCYNGDPGSNGCVNAGRLLEGKQQFAEAIHYYRLSKWGPSQEAANKLAEKFFATESEIPDE